MMTRIGISSLLAGLFLALFSGISNFMASQNFWVDLTLSKLLGEDKVESLITWFTAPFMQNSLDILFYEIPVYGLLFLLGGVFLIISLFVKVK
jgi:hypothetical protein